MTEALTDSRTPVLVVAGLSGSGKTSLLNELRTRVPGIGIAVSHTTRPRRSGEIDGNQYHFVSESQFADLKQDGAFLETAEVFGYRYGVSWNSLKFAQQDNRLVVLEIDWQGAQSVQRSDFDSTSVFILPPDVQSQRQRLRDRGLDSSNVIEVRIEKSKDDAEHFDEFTHFIINDSFDTALAQLEHLVHATIHRLDVNLPNVDKTVKQIQSQLLSS